MPLKRIPGLAFCALAALPAFGQLTGSVSVEGEYAPIIIETDRLNTFPAGYKFELPAANIDYEFAGIVADYRPSLLTMGVTGRQTALEGAGRRGFVDFRLGSWLNSRLHAGCTLLADSRNTLNLDLKFASSALYRMHGLPEGYTRLPRKRLYDGRIGLDYSRATGDDGLLTARAGYRLGYFNYYGTTVRESLLPLGADRIDIPTQTVNGVDAGVGYNSSTSFIRGWNASAAVNYLGYRRLYAPVLSDYRSRGARETTLNAAGGYNFAAGDNGAVNISVKGDFLFYGGGEPDALASYYNENFDATRNYGIVTITPSYRFATTRLKLQAGIDVITSYDAMGSRSGESFGSVHLAPAVSADYSVAGFGLFASAKGGATPASLALMEKFDRYQMPWALSTRPVYSPVDAKIGFTVGPFAGFDATAAVRYAVARGVPLGGWYQAWLGAWLSRPFSLDATAYADPYARSIDMHGIDVILGLRYAYGTLFNLSFDAVYTPQKGKRGIFNGFDRPRWILSAKAGVRPIERLNIEVGYDYRGVRNCYGYSFEGPDALPQLSAYRLPDITDLNAKISFRILDTFDLYCKGENLLGRRVALLPGLQSEGVVIQGGFYVEF